jgi:hypothetical protein
MRPFEEERGADVDVLPFEADFEPRAEGEALDEDLPVEALEVVPRPFAELLPEEPERLLAEADDLPDVEERGDEADFLLPALLLLPDEDLVDDPRPEEERPDDELPDFFINNWF